MWLKQFPELYTGAQGRFMKIIYLNRATRFYVLCPNYKNTENYAFGAKNMNDRKKYIILKKGDPIFYCIFSNGIFECCNC